MKLSSVSYCWITDSELILSETEYKFQSYCYFVMLLLLLCYCCLSPKIWNLYNIYLGRRESGFNCWGVRGPRSCYSCFAWMYVECVRDLACRPSLWRYRIPGLSSESGGLSPGSTLVTASRFLAGNRKAKLKPTTWILLHRVFLFSKPIQQYSAFECCLMELIIIIIIIIIIIDLMIDRW